MKGYKIELSIGEDVLKELEQEMMVKKITGNFLSTQDEFFFLLLKAWKEGKAKLHIKTKGR